MPLRSPAPGRRSPPTSAPRPAVDRVRAGAYRSALRPSETDCAVVSAAKLPVIGTPVCASGDTSPAPRIGVASEALDGREVPAGAATASVSGLFSFSRASYAAISSATIGAARHRLSAEERLVRRGQRVAHGGRRWAIPPVESERPIDDLDQRRRQLRSRRGDRSRGLRGGVDDHLLAALPLAHERPREEREHRRPDGPYVRLSNGR